MRRVVHIGSTLVKFEIKKTKLKRLSENKSSVSALKEHNRDKNNGIEGIRIDFIAKLNNTRNTIFTEAKAKTLFKRSINRKYESPFLHISTA